MAYRWTEDDAKAVLKRLAVKPYAAELQAAQSMRPRSVPQIQPIASPAASPKARTQKYGNRKVTDAEGNVHDSAKEYRRWCDLQLRQRAGEISELRRQRVFELVVNDVLVGKYKADATYIENGELVVEDTKPDDPKFRKTLAYRHFKLKALLMQAIHKIQVHEV